MGLTSAKVNFCSAWLTSSVLVICQTVLADLTCKPLDSESRVNESTYFNCSSSITTKEINWFHYPVGIEAHERKSVYAFGKFYKDYVEDFELDKNSLDGVYNLAIRSVKPGYAGRYECQDNGGKGSRHSAQLIILDADLVCISNINAAGVNGPNTCGIPHEELHLSCSVNYHGNIPPKLMWSRVGENDSISENVTKELSANVITYNLTVRANLLVDDSSYECQTTNSRTSKHSCTSETLRLLCSGTTDSTDSSSSAHLLVAVLVPVVLVISVILILLLFIICRRKQTHEEAGEKTVGDVVNPIPLDPSQDAYPLLRINGATEGNQVVISANADDEYIDAKETFEEHPGDSFKPGKRKKTDESRNEAYTDCDLKPALLRVESIKSSDDNKAAVSGLTVLHKELFIVFERSSEVKVFQAVTFSPVRLFMVTDLDNPLDVASSPMDNCLYISSPNKVYKVDENGEVLVTWTVHEGSGTLSITDNRTVILSVWKRSALEEYSADGHMIQEVRLPSDVRPFHTVKIRVNQFVVSHERGMVHNVCIADANGSIILYFNGMLKFPRYLAVNTDGYIFVADQNNSRVLLVSPTLKSSSVLLSSNNGLGRPWRIYLGTNDQMFVADNKSDDQKFMVFQLYHHKTGTSEEVPVIRYESQGSNSTLEEDPSEEVRPGKRKR